ncbi:DUF7576 family protein [Haladaptatus sp. NG-SE-30]
MNDIPGTENVDARVEVESPMDTPVCAQCGDPIDTTSWFPVVTETTEDGSVRLHSFCDKSCHDAWKTD